VKTKRIISCIFLLSILTYTVDGTWAADQKADTILTANDTYQGEEAPGPDSVIIKGNQMINEAEQASKILNESLTIGMLDSLNSVPYFQDYYFNTDTALLNIYNFPMGYVPMYPDSVYKARIEKLNQQTTIDLTYNKTVKTFIDLYAVKKRQLTSKMLGMKEIYFPLFEEYLDKYDIPLEIKYLAVVESALNPTAGSRAGAKGLWQFMYYTGKIYGLKVTSLVDDRFDPYLATDAACRHMVDLYAMFGDWNLVMAAYNSGAGNVKKAIRRSGGVKDYWAIWPFLPRETRGYVPAFIAVNYVMSFASEHNLYPLDPGILYGGIDTVWVNQPLSFDQISEYLNIPMDEVKFLNPIFKSNIIPAYKGKSYSLRLPDDLALKFAENELALYNYKSKSGLEKEKLMAEIKKATERQYHTVRSGENLGLIAKKYHVSVKKLKQWNRLRGSLIRPGQKLIIYPSANYTYVPSSSSSSSSKSKSNNPAKTSKAKYHTVRSGENLGLIAKKYDCSIENIKSWNNLKKNTIYPKQKLRVSADSSSSNDLPVASAKGSGGKSKYVYYTVKKGDTLWDIANLYKGVSVKDLKKWNNMGNSSKLKIGQKLKIEKNG